MLKIEKKIKQNDNDNRNFITQETPNNPIKSKNLTSIYSFAIM